MAHGDLLERLSSLFKDEKSKIHTVEVMVCGATDLCHPKLDDQYDLNCAVQEPAERLGAQAENEAVFMVSVQQLLQQNYIHGVGKHTLDGWCSMNRFEEKGGLIVLNDVCFGIFLAFCLWFKYLLERQPQVRKILFLMICTAGKHRSMYCGRLLFVLLTVLFKISSLEATVQFTWGAQARCAEEAQGAYALRQPHIVVDRFRHLWQAWVRKHGLVSATFRVDDAVYERSKRKVQMQVGPHGGRLVTVEPFDVVLFLLKVQHNLPSTPMNLVHGQKIMPLTLWLASQDAYHAWQDLFHKYIRYLWPKQCSLCCLERNVTYAFEKSVTHIFAEVLARKRAPVRAAASTGAESQGRGKAKSTTACSSTSVRTATEPQKEPKQRPATRSAAAKSDASSMNASSTTSKRSTSVRTAADVGHGEERVKKKFRQDLPDTLTSAWMATVDVDTCTVAQWHEAKLKEVDLLYVMQDGSSKKYYGICAGSASSAMQELADALMADATFLTEFNASETFLCQNSKLPFEAMPSKNNLAKIQCVIFWHLMSIATLRSQDLQSGATAAFLALVGLKFLESLQIDIIDLIHNFVWLLWLLRNMTDSTWLDDPFMIFVPKTEKAQHWWILQQEHLGMVSRKSFAREYACIRSCPYTEVAELEGELGALKQRLLEEVISVSPDLPAQRYWYQHDAAVLAQVAMVLPRPLPCFRSSAHPTPCVWGNGDGKRGTVDRRNMIADTHIYVQVAGPHLPPDLSLQTVLGANFLHQFVAGLKLCSIRIPEWLLACIDGGASDSAVDVQEAQPRDASASDSAVDAVAQAYVTKWLPQAIYQCLGASLMAVIRPDTVLHPHLRGHFELHMGLLLAKEMRLKRLDTKLCLFLQGCGINFDTKGNSDEHWLHNMLNRRSNAKQSGGKPAIPTPALHSMWGEKLRPEWYYEKIYATELCGLYLVGLTCQEAFQTQHPCALHREFAGSGTICNQYHSFSKKHGLMLFFHVLQWLNCSGIGDRGTDSAKNDDSFVYTLCKELGFVPANSRSYQNYHKTPESRLQLLGLPRYLPCHYSNTQVNKHSKDGLDKFTTYPGAMKMRKNFLKEDVERLSSIEEVQVKVAKAIQDLL
eukprot:s597_g3.t1